MMTMSVPRALAAEPPADPAIDKSHLAFSPYRVFTRADWARLRADTPMTLVARELDQLSGLIEDLSVGEVEQIYLPLSRLLNLHVAAAQELHAATSRFVGRLDPRNDLRTLLDAARILADEGREFVVQVVGDGSGREDGHRQAEELGIADRIQWLGEQDRERPRLYREADVFAAPCTIASFGVVLLEALASGTPLVCADNIGFNQVIRDGMPGRFHTPHDPRSLAAGIAELLDDPAKREEWGRTGRALTEERYAWTSVAARIDDVYREVYEARGGAPRPHPPVGVRFNLKRNPWELIKGIPGALRAGDPEAHDGGVGEPRPDQMGDGRNGGDRRNGGRPPSGGPEPPAP